MVRETEDIFHFGGPREMELDVTETPAVVTAQKILEFIGVIMCSQEDLK